MTTKDQVYSHSELDGKQSSQKNTMALNAKYRSKRRKASKLARKQRKFNSIKG